MAHSHFHYSFRPSYYPITIFLIFFVSPTTFSSEQDDTQIGRKTYNGYKLFRLNLASLKEVQKNKIIRWLNHFRMPMLDVWTGGLAHRNRTSPYFDILAAPEISGKFMKLMLKRKDNGMQLISNDIQKEIDQEKRTMNRRRRGKKRRTANNKKHKLDFANYNSYKRISNYLKTIAIRNPEFVELLNLTRTFEGRNLLGVNIGKRDGRRKPMIFIDSGVHAREWIAPAAAVYAIDKLISSASHQHLPELTTLLENFQIVIVPVANPDGYEYSMTKDRLWRKTRSKNGTGDNGICVGADANRNWGYRWAESGASRHPCSSIFPGWTPFSEPEVRGIHDYLVNRLDQVVAYISLHSYGQMILSPWGYTTDKPANFGEQQKLAEIAIQAIQKSTGATYLFGTIADLLYPASGTSIDYWQHRGVSYIYGIELRPEDGETELLGFAVHPDQIEPTGKELITIIKEIGKYLMKKINKEKGEIMEEESRGGEED